MVEDIEYEEALKKLKKYGQEHLLSRYQYLNDEKKEKIIEQIEAGIKKTNGKYECITNRREAIKKAISMATKSVARVIRASECFCLTRWTE